MEFSFCYAHVLHINPLLLSFDIFSGTHVRPCVQVATPLCVFSFLYLNLSTVVIDSLKQNFRCDVFVGVSDRIQSHSVLFGREDDGD